MKNEAELRKQYARALAAHNLPDTEANKQLYAAGVATGVGMTTQCLRDEKYDIAPDTIFAMDTIVVDAMEFGGGAPDNVPELRQIITGNYELRKLLAEKDNA